ncbi:LysM peptidoglycan-binding domain-containing protein [Flavobacterium piscinae]|uniref:LysM peptidoglycan-binding domain-containing protein n=1 Tax=Flavobacterium piscinae TaxID=2506424 RepID=A0A4Q1KTZ9_9FLAO|nr:LysM peptidoglycan-binding domain-containing protein [Flavobacterium piscinae]MBC8883636.1 LysM peptidoglycan-binding domain-containing protein [Flavobacterium piscinae]RXR33663.1 LysM peptidoglycan-binding domain-containing protein [Flavobacterium piscinae]
MNLRNTTLLVVLFSACVTYAQDSTLVDVNTAAEPKLSYLDSIKSTFQKHEIAACVDERWMNELSNQDLYSEMIADIENTNLDEKVEYDLSTELLKERLKALDAKSAFHIEYNPGLENIIKHYLKNRKRSYERLMALSQYYFPIFEEALAKYNVPLEIKYLAVVESALNPRAVSRAGATGLWQFMYGTGKQYNLDITTFTDERSDLLKATDAACQYMVNMYKIFGDWDLVLASYNAGPGNVSKAIRRSGGKQNYWNIRPYLPKETQGYVPAFLATMYVFEYHKEHGIVPQKPIVNHFATDTIMVKNKMSFKQISDLLDISMEQLQFLNPMYKRDFIPYQTDKNHFLRLPLDKVAVFTSNENKIYAYCDYEFNQREKPFSSQEMLATSDVSIVTKTKYHKVRRGESLGLIAKKNGVTVTELKRWNGLRSNTIAAGKNLKILKEEKVAVTPKKVIENPVAKAVVSNDTVKVKNDKPLEAVNYHIVEKGESLFSIAQKYEITNDELKEWNELEDENILIGSKLIVRPLEKQMTENHIVQSGENLNTIAKKYNVTIDELKEWNELEDNNIKLGTTLKIMLPADEEVVVAEVKTKKPEKQSPYKSEKIYIVQKGDSLFSISQKIKGVTVSDLKKWNGISGKTIKPGMKLKISG